MKQWVSCFAILLGLLILSPVKAHAYATAYGEAYIDWSSLRISVKGDIDCDFFSGGYLEANISDDTIGLYDSQFVSIPSGELNNSFYASAETSFAEAQAKLNFYDFKGTVNVNSNGIHKADSYSYGGVGYEIYAPENGNGGWVIASVNYVLTLDLRTTSIGEEAGGYAKVSLYLSDDCSGTYDDYLLDKTALNGDAIHAEYPGTLEVSYFFYPGSSGDLSIVLETSAGITSPVPLPSTILLLGSGMLWMVGYRRKCLNKKC